MKTVILAGGYGTRIGDESQVRPKPLIEIGGRPILWHIMKIYAAHGFDDFVLCLGYKGQLIKEYIVNYSLYESDVAVKSGTNPAVSVLSPPQESWSIILASTGLETATGGRISKIQRYIGNETFMMTYGDGVADVDIPRLLEFHRSHGRVATVTGVQPGGRFGSLEIGEDNVVVSFKEKPHEDGNWVNGGFFVFEPSVFDYIDGDLETCVFEERPMERLAREGQLMVYKHRGFWHPMDTVRDKKRLENFWLTGAPPWKVW